MILLGDAIQRAEVDTETERTVFLLDEENWSAVRRGGLPDETSGDVFVDKGS